jgi:transcriptional regulator with XRE-family HTH domain
VTDVQAVTSLTGAAAADRIATVPPEDLSRFQPAETFGTWLKYLRQLTGLTQEQAAKDAQVSVDAVRRMERGRLIGSAHLLAWLAWLATEAVHLESPDVDAETLSTEVEQFREKLEVLGNQIREAGLANQPPKAHSLRAKRPAKPPVVATKEKKSGHRFRQREASDRPRKGDRRE